jgi:hypothetical protein
MDFDVAKNAGTWTEHEDITHRPTGERNTKMR